ncbi:MAG: response regulator transcription factor [Actinomycetales bacterium]|nr:response regulator transcription factor [Actinomycetales bacterium]
MTISIAVVDDHRLVRDGLARACEASGRMSVAYEGSSVEEVLQVEKPPHVVLLDIDLHSREVGVDEVSALIERGSAVIVVSATVKPHLVHDFLTAGVRGFVSKSDPTESLLEAIDAVHAGQDWTTPELAGIISRDPRRPNLSAKEIIALQLYASGMKLESVARRMDVAPTTAREYINRVRAKYAAIGRPAPTKLDLHRIAAEDGYLA